MLNFDSTHKSISGSLEKKDKRKIVNMVVSGLLVSSIILFSGCAKTVDCSIEGLHAHNFVNENSFNHYIVSEKEYKGNYHRIDDYIMVTEEEKAIIDFENKKGLFRIDQNKDKLNEIISTQNDYIEYRYKYTYMQPVPHIRRIGKVTSVWYSYIPRTGHSWTTDATHSRLTGEQRVVHYVYYGYKIIEDEKGKLKIEKSERVDSLEELPSEYCYIKKDFYKKVHLDNKDLEVDYEDGPEEDKKLSEEQQQEYEEQLENEKTKSK